MRPQMAFPSARRGIHREIKFRAWSIKGKTMSPATTLEGWVGAVDQYSNDDDLLVAGNMWEQPELLGVRGQGGM
jgi:hypothetical protein